MSMCTWVTLSFYIFYVYKHYRFIGTISCKVMHGEKITHGDHQIHSHPKKQKYEELYPTGSNIPDCSHACGPCFPCKRVMIGYKCPMTESCPVIYRCICRGRYYHVPSN
ncbi:unnamed protein product [Lactuca virosa]|uniref:Epidermal patterning factor-like protein n=1 Tax=Lactuca virosa TaxID=75947 RepID=A0AAU9P7R9_9ASTR|nr:unnamed protein product [Lactuca virosa]